MLSRRSRKALHDRVLALLRVLAAIAVMMVRKGVEAFIAAGVAGAS